MWIASVYSNLVRTWDSLAKVENVYDTMAMQTDESSRTSRMWGTLRGSPKASYCTVRSESDLTVKSDSDRTV